MGEAGPQGSVGSLNSLHKTTNGCSRGHIGPQGHIGHQGPVASGQQSYYEHCINTMIHEFVTLQRNALQRCIRAAGVCTDITNIIIDYFCPDFDLVSPQFCISTQIILEKTNFHTKNKEFQPWGQWGFGPQGPQHFLGPCCLREIYLHRRHCSPSCVKAVMSAYLCLQRDALRPCVANVFTCDQVENMVLDFCCPDFDLLPIFF